jgi:TRAP-type C4-dicarboxylate transport system substrate-binding protein
VKAGTLDAVVTDVAIMSAAVPEADVFVLPFLFSDSAQMLRASAGPLGVMLKPKLAKAFACEILGFSTDGAHNMWNSKHPTPMPADFAGIKMRVSPSKIQRDTYSALGAIPTPLPFSEVYTSLQTGVVDGADFAPVDMVELKLYQVTKYLTLTRHFSSLSVLIVGDKFLAKLSEADRDAVRAAGAVAVDAQTNAVFAAEKDALDTLRAKGIQIVEMADPKGFLSAVEPVYKNNEGRVSADLVALARQTA